MINLVGIGKSFASLFKISRFNDSNYKNSNYIKKEPYVSKYPKNNNIIIKN
jgi:hypothetical protein